MYFFNYLTFNASHIPNLLENGQINKKDVKHTWTLKLSRPSLRFLTNWINAFDLINLNMQEYRIPL